MNETASGRPLHLDVERLSAIDVHVHLHPPDDHGRVDRAARKYFGAAVDPDWGALAEHYRSRRMACVVFAVDERLTGRPPVANDAVLDFAAKTPTSRSPSSAWTRTGARRRYARRAASSPAAVSVA